MANRRKNDTALLVIILLNAVAWSVAAFYLIDFRIMTNESKRLNREAEQELEELRRKFSIGGFKS